MKIKRYNEVNFHHPVFGDYVVIRKDSDFYEEFKGIIYQITNWNSEEYYLTDFNGNKLHIKWGDAKHLNKKELKKLDYLKDVKKYNL